MTERQAWDLAFDPATGRRLRQEEVKSGVLPDSRWPNFFSRVVAKLQWDANGIDLGPDAHAWPEPTPSPCTSSRSARPPRTRSSRG
jgi:hypothetical protein